MSIYANRSGTSKSCQKVFQARTQSREISNFGNILPYQNSPTSWDHLDTPIFSNENRYINSMITMFLIMTSIFKTSTMLIAMKVNLLVSISTGLF